MKVLINERLSQHKMKTDEGYLICTDAVLARTGKQQYRKADIWADSEDPDSIIDIDRRPEDVFADSTLASFENKPITIEHPDVDVNTENYHDYAVGFVRDVRKGKDGDMDVIVGDLVFTDQRAIDLIESGEMNELSCGYNCDITPGDDPHQINIKGNHVALCKQGRAGNARIIDSNVEDAADASAILKEIVKIFAENMHRIGIVKVVKQSVSSNSARIQTKYVDKETAEDYGANFNDFADDLTISYDGTSFMVSPGIRSAVDHFKTAEELVKAFNFRSTPALQKLQKQLNETEYYLSKDKGYFYLDSMKDADDSVIDELIKDEQEAIAAYEEAMKDASEVEKAIYSHIIKEELEHIEELKNLKTAMTMDSIDLDDIEMVDPKDIDTQNYVIGKNDVWFAKLKSEKELLTRAFCSYDKGKTWHTCYLETKSDAHDGKTQVGKFIFRTSRTFNGPRTSIGRNVLTWYAGNGHHRVDEGYEIDHVDGNFKNDKLSNLELVSHAENIRRRNAMMKKDSNVEIRNVRGHYEGYVNGKFVCSGDSYKEVEDELDEYLANTIEDSVYDGHYATGSTRERLKQYLDWEGIYGYDIDNLIKLAKKGRDYLRDYLEEEGIFGYDVPIYQIVVQNQKPWIDDSKVKDEPDFETPSGKRETYFQRMMAALDVVEPRRWNRSGMKVNIDNNAVTLVATDKGVTIKTSKGHNETFVLTEQIRSYLRKLGFANPKAKDSMKDSVMIPAGSEVELFHTAPYGSKVELIPGTFKYKLRKDYTAEDVKQLREFVFNEAVIAWNKKHGSDIGGTVMMEPSWKKAVIKRSNDSMLKDIDPRKGESKEDFISRFMSETEEEYPDEKQRLAVAYSYWENKHMKDSLSLPLQNAIKRGKLPKGSIYGGKYAAKIKKSEAAAYAEELKSAGYKVYGFESNPYVSYNFFFSDSISDSREYTIPIKKLPRDVVGKIMQTIDEEHIDYYDADDGIELSISNYDRLDEALWQQYKMDISKYTVHDSFIEDSTLQLRSYSTDEYVGQKEDVQRLLKKYKNVRKVRYSAPKWPVLTGIIELSGDKAELKKFANELGKDKPDIYDSIDDSFIEDAEYVTVKNPYNEKTASYKVSDYCIIKFPFYAFAKPSRRQESGYFPCKVEGYYRSGRVYSNTLVTPISNIYEGIEMFSCLTQSERAQDIDNYVGRKFSCYAADVKNIEKHFKKATKADLEAWFKKSGYEVLDSVKDGAYDPGEAYYYAHTGDHVKIDGKVYEIDWREHKIGYGDIIDLLELPSRKPMTISKADFVKKAQLLKDSIKDSNIVTKKSTGEKFKILKIPGDGFVYMTSLFDSRTVKAYEDGFKDKYKMKDVKAKDADVDFDTCKRLASEISKKFHVEATATRYSSIACEEVYGLEDLDRQITAFLKSKGFKVMFNGIDDAGEYNISK